MKRIVNVPSPMKVSRSGKPESDLAFVLYEMMCTGVLTWCGDMAWFGKAGTYTNGKCFLVHPDYLVHLLQQNGCPDCTLAEVKMALLEDELLVTGPKGEIGTMVKNPKDNLWYPVYCLHMSNILDAASYFADMDSELPTTEDSVEPIVDEGDFLHELGLL